ncbi:hypothetical protein TRVL_07601 [Trypanosoma vivax]|nr:hypothetical protein TRVL_07601 [Trypanosoma vivax]
MPYSCHHALACAKRPPMAVCASSGRRPRFTGLLFCPPGKVSNFVYSQASTRIFALLLPRRGLCKPPVALSAATHFSAACDSPYAHTKSAHCHGPSGAAKATARMGA